MMDCRHMQICHSFPPPRLASRPHPRSRPLTYSYLPPATSWSSLHTSSYSSHTSLPRPGPSPSRTWAWYLDSLMDSSVPLCGGRGGEKGGGRGGGGYIHNEPRKR